MDLESTAAVDLKTERTIAQQYTQRFEPWIVLEAIVVIGAWLGIIVGATSGLIPIWLGALANSWLAWSCYLLMHEATHGTVDSRRKSPLKWLNDAVGYACAVPLLMSYREHQASHMLHHAHTNVPGRDPDVWTRGRFRSVLGRVLLIYGVLALSPVLYWFPSLAARLPSEVSRFLRLSRPYEARKLRANETAITAVLVLAIAAGFGWEAFLLWYLPGRIGTALVVFLLGWLPHAPHRDTSRYGNSRVTLFPGSSLFLIGHDHHLVHHMFPRVAHFRMRRLFDELRPSLERHGARVEGSRAGSNAPPIRVDW